MTGYKKPHLNILRFCTTVSRSGTETLEPWLQAFLHSTQTKSVTHFKDRWKFTCNKGDRYKLFLIKKNEKYKSL